MINNSIKFNDESEQVFILSTILNIILNNNKSMLFDNNIKLQVISFQNKYGLIADGIIGPKTLTKIIEVLSSILTQKGDNNIMSQSKLVKYDDLFKVYGDFRTLEWYSNNIKFCNLIELQDKLNHIKGFHRKDGFGLYCNKNIIEPIQLVMKLICENNINNELKTYDGCYNVRQIRKGNKWSVHSWGLAVDFNAAENQLGMSNYKMHPKIIECFEEIGFVSGARWKRPDAMHFQWCVS